MTQEVASARRAATTIGRCMIRKVVELKSQLIYLYMASTIIIISLSPAFRDESIEDNNPQLKVSC